MGRYIYRLFGASVMDAGTYESLEADPSVGGQAAITVLLAAFAAAVGLSGLTGFTPARLAGHAAVAVVLWIAWAVLMFQIGARVFPGRGTKTSLGELLRTTGFAAAPGIFQVFAVFSGAAPVVFAATGLWMFAAMVVAIRHALDYETIGRAAGVAAAALALCATVAIALAASFATVVR